MQLCAALAFLAQCIPESANTNWNFNLWEQLPILSLHGGKYRSCKSIIICLVCILCWPCLQGCRQGDAKRLQRASTSSIKKQLAKDEAYAEYLGYTLDIVFGCFLLVGYIIAAVLIFVLQVRLVWAC